MASMSMTDALMRFFTASWCGHQKDALNSGSVKAVDLGDITWGRGRAFT
jgi:hypothetical protein